MLIDEAIEILEALKTSGTKAVVMITMTSDNFGMEDDGKWAELAQLAENDLRVLDGVTDAVEYVKEEEDYDESSDDSVNEYEDERGVK